VEFLEAPLTDEEIAAIDEAGAKGPSALATTVFSNNNARSHFFTMILCLWMLAFVAGCRLLRF
jgi:hypothetical protein